MANVKAYSVAMTQGGDVGTNDSTVYSIQQGRQDAYDKLNDQQLQEGRRKTLLKGKRTAANYDVTAVATATVGSEGTARADLASKVVVATTTAKTGDGAGLILKFTVAAAGALPAFGSGTAGSAFTSNDYVIVDAGEGYDTSDTVEIDGWPGSSLVVTAA